MKTIFLVSSLIVSVGAFATCEPGNSLDENVPAGRCYGQERDLRSECSDNPSITLARIASKSTCAEAAKLARVCAYGSNIDVQFAGEAATICLKEVEYPSAYSQELLVEQKKECVAQYGRLQGSLARSNKAYCVLGAIESYNRLNQPGIE